MEYKINLKQTNGELSDRVVQLRGLNYILTETIPENLIDNQPYLVSQFKKSLLDFISEYTPKEFSAILNF